MFFFFVFPLPQLLFYDRTTSNIQLHTITKGSTIVTWYNKTLSNNDICPRDEIKRLESLLVNSDRTIASRVQDIMDPEFPVKSIKLQMIGSCKGRILIHTTEQTYPPIDESTPSRDNSDEYLITFIVPAVIITVILLLAGIVACVLYRKRRTGKGKLNRDDEDVHQSYGNKGIPVIFQEELDEKPESGTKTPVSNKLFLFFEQIVPSFMIYLHF